MFIVVPSYIHVSQSLHMLHLVLLLAYSEHNPAKHLKPPKLMEFVSLTQIMHRNIFIPTIFTEKLVVDVVINNHQQLPTSNQCKIYEQHKLDVGYYASPWPELV